MEQNLHLQMVLPRCKVQVREVGEGVLGKPLAVGEGEPEGSC